MPLSYKFIKTIQRDLTLVIVHVITCTIFLNHVFNFNFDYTKDRIKFSDNSLITNKEKLHTMLLIFYISNIVCSFSIITRTLCIF